MPYRDYAKKKEWAKRYYELNKLYYVALAKKRKQKLRKWLNEIKSGLKCSRCTETDPCVLDFHHRDDGAKEYNLSELIRKNAGKKRILCEIEKCDVLCSNCHRKLHAGRFD